MRPLQIIATWCLVTGCLPFVVQARVWTDTTGQYKLEAELIAMNDDTVILKREDHELVAIPIDQLSKQDREYLQSPEAADAAKKIADAPQTWTLRDGTKIVGRVVDFAACDMTVGRRRGHVYINDRRLDNLPELYQQLAPKIVAHFEKMPIADRRALDAWVLRQRGQPRTFKLEGVVLELESGDEYSVPFFLFSDEDLKLLKPGWNEWLEVHTASDFDKREHHAYLLQSLAAARMHDKKVQREIAMMQLKLQAVQAGLTSLWEVTLRPTSAHMGPPQWVVVPGRDSRQAAQNAVRQFPGFEAGPIRRVSN